MNDLFKLLDKNDWLWLIYQITFDKTTGIKFRDKNPLPKDLTTFLKKHGIFFSKENKLKHFPEICKDYKIYEDMKTYLLSTRDDETIIVKTLIDMSCKLNRKPHIGEFFGCFMQVTSDECFRLTFNEQLFDYVYGYQLPWIERIIKLLEKHHDIIEKWYDETSAMTDVFDPRDKQYCFWFQEKDHALLYYKKKEDYREKAMKNLRKFKEMMEPPPPPQDDEATSWPMDWWEENYSGSEEEPEWRDPPSCSAEPHNCKCQICVLQNLQFCKCPECLQEKALNEKILAQSTP
jgi:hypothetical protein